MNDQDYSLAQDRLVCAASFARKTDWDAFIRRIKSTNNAAIFLDAELYTDLKDIEAIAAAAAAMNNFKRDLVNIQQQYRQRRARRNLKGET